MKKYFKIFSEALAIVLLMLALVFCCSIVQAQSIVRKGNTFIEQKDSTSRGGSYEKTEYLYTDSKGVTDTVYLSKNGSAFIWKVSKKTGRTYRRYLPEITKQLGTRKEKDEKD